MLRQKAEFLTGFGSLESMGLGKIFIKRFWGILILVRRWALGRKETLMLYIQDSVHWSPKKSLRIGVCNIFCRWAI